MEEGEWPTDFVLFMHKGGRLSLLLLLLLLLLL
jgi:hypothetical protein